MFTDIQHRDALIRRRIKFVVEKGAMARLFRARTHRDLQDELVRSVDVSQLAVIQTRDEYDSWLVSKIESTRWKRFSRHGLANDRWAYFAKLLNIVIYEVISNRELFSDVDWTRLRSFLHIPVDSTVTLHLSSLEPTFPRVTRLKGMTKREYLEVQNATRRLAEVHGVPPIWFEAAWSARD